jgi:hypothetical protein
MRVRVQCLQSRPGIVSTQSSFGARQELKLHAQIASRVHGRLADCGNGRRYCNSILFVPSSSYRLHGARTDL